MEPTQRKLKKGDVVQLLPSAGEPLAGCFMVVTELKTWGAKGNVRTVNNGHGGLVKIQARWEDMEYIGQAHLVPKDD